MAVNVCEVMQYCRNFFEDGYIDADFTISAGGKLTPVDGIVSGQYIAVSGSQFHDGVYQLDGYMLETESPAESFSGRIWTLAPTASFLKLCEDISEYSEKNKPSDKVSESFGAYSYTRATGATGTLKWSDVFAERLQPFKRMFTEVSV